MPITRKEALLNSISGGSSANVSPITREEQYLAYIAGESSSYPQNPITREEMFLDKIAKSGVQGGGGSSVNVIPLSITENGTYTAPSGSAYSPINVNVASSGGESGENNLAKVVDKSITEITAKDLEGATAIGSYAFSWCYNLTNIEIPNSVTKIGVDVFYACKQLTSVTFAENSTLTDIGNEAFYSCENLQSINIPDSLTSIGGKAFYNCKKLTSINIPNGVTSIGSSVFYQCYGLKSIEIPNSVTSIGNEAFYYCTNLTSVTIPNSLALIQASVFRGCSNLTSIEIPNSVTSIGDSAFRECKKLTSITINADTAPTLSSVNAFTNVPTTCIFYVKNLDSYNSTNWVAMRDKYTFVEKVEPSEGLTYTLRSDGASYSVSGMGTCTDTKLVIPDTYEGYPVREIGANAFENNKDIVSVIIPEGVLKIGDDAFMNCQNVGSVTIPESMQIIGSEAFYNCLALTSVTIPSGVTYLGRSAFDYCGILASVTIKTATPPTLYYANDFSGLSPNCVFRVYNLSAYQTATNWSRLIDIYTFEEIEE